jgi:hypothetical protein
VTKSEILVVFSAPDSGPLGNVWVISASKSSFYLNPHSTTNPDTVAQSGNNANFFHLSAHGPKIGQPGHRFHLRLDSEKIGGADAFLRHSIPEEGYEFDGIQLAPAVFQVARIRWRPELQRPRLRRTATRTARLPPITEHQQGARLSTPLGDHQVADLDLVVSYDMPYWPGGEQSLLGGARLGPLWNDARDLCLTATSFRRPVAVSPTPPSIDTPSPGPDDEAMYDMRVGPHGEPGEEMYWFVETITTRQAVEAPDEDQF